MNGKRIIRWLGLGVGLALLAGSPVSLGSKLPLYIIFDGSNSMWGELPDKSRKIETAKEVFNQFDPEIFAGREIALRLYGHRRASDCSDTELAVPFGHGNSTLSDIADRINNVTPKGKTPITRSLTAALKDFNGRSGDILLISDGIETCDADPCELMRSWQELNIDIRVHVVGLGLSDVSKAAMKCIADASQTRYMDANSADELAMAIEQAASSDVPEPAEPEPIPDEPGPEFRIWGEDSDGNFLPVAGFVSGQGLDSHPIASNHRYVIEGGEYSISVGVPTLNGEIFAPITKNIVVKDQGTTEVVVTLRRPPVIITQFMEAGEQVPGTNASAYQGDNEVFRVRPNEEHFVMPGTYLFRAKLNQDNDLSIEQTLSEGGYRVIEFTAAETVRTVVQVFPQGSDKQLRQHQEFVQNGEVKYKVHWSNGADVLPGIYTVRSDHPLTPYVLENVEVLSGNAKQTTGFEVPFASVKPLYLFAGEPSSTDLRCWIERLDETGSVADSSRAKQCNGETIYLTEGSYQIRVWDRLGNFVSTPFIAISGQTTEVVIEEQ